MTAKPEIQNVEQTCEIVKRWFGWQEDRPGLPISLPFAVPPAIATVNRCFGHIWNDATQKDLRWFDAQEKHLFNCQDTLVPPYTYALDEKGVVPLFWENQGVWGAGFKPETDNRLWVIGDWPDDRCGERVWRPAHDTVDTIITYVLLSNTILLADDPQYDDEDGRRPEGLNRLLFTFAPFSDFQGFWTNDNVTALSMQGHGWSFTAYRNIS